MYWKPLRSNPLHQVRLACVSLLFFFFSSRRRHTRLQGDWSSDVCSSDLPPAGARVWIDTTSFTPTDTLAFPVGEGIRLSVRATPGARVRLRMEGRKGEVWFVPDTLPEEPAWGVRAFGTDTSAYRLPPAVDRFVAWLPAEPLCDAIVEVIVGTDTARAVWPLVLDTLDRAHPAVVVLNDDTAHTGTSDSLTVGKAVPYGTYNWFFPLGTISVATARWGSQTRLH